MNTLHYHIDSALRALHIVNLQLKNTFMLFFTSVYTIASSAIKKRCTWLGKGSIPLYGFVLKCSAKTMLYILNSIGVGKQ